MKKIIVLSTNNAKRPFDGKTTKLGGGWQVPMAVSKFFAEYGNKVFFFANCEDKSGEGIEVDGYKLIDRKWLKHFLSKHEVDYYLAEREMPINRKNYRIKQVFFHLQNTPMALHPSELKQWKKAKLFDKVIFVSEWHRDLALKKGFPIKDTYILRNGFNYLDVKGEKKKNRIIWASNPKRGLKILAEQIFPELKKIMPEMELHVAGSHKIYNFYDNVAERMDAEGYGCLYKGKFGGELKDGYFYYGALEQPELSQFFHEGTLLVYPLSNFSETGSIVVVQSQGYLTPVIVRDRCVMPELIGRDSDNPRGFCINDNCTINDWVESIKNVLAEKRYKIFQENCKAWRENYYWKNIMPSVDSDFNKFLEGK